MVDGTFGLQIKIFKTGIDRTCSEVVSKWIENILLSDETVIGNQGSPYI